MQTQTYVGVPQFFLLRTKLESPSIPKLDSYFLQHNLWTIFEGPKIFMLTTALGPCEKWSYVSIENVD